MATRKQRAFSTILTRKSSASRAIRALWPRRARRWRRAFEGGKTRRSERSMQNKNREGDAFAANASGAEPRQRRFGHFRRGNAEIFVELLIRPARAESGHADEWAVADQRVPTLAHRRLDPDPHPRLADNLSAV